MFPRSVSALACLALCLCPLLTAVSEPASPELPRTGPPSTGLPSTGLPSTSPPETELPSIDRRALVTRHSPTLTRIDPTAPLMVGNGNIALTADITGLATFQDRYSPLAPLLIQAQWAWHSFPNPQNYAYADSLVALDVRGKTQHFPWLRASSESARPLIAWLRENPHRFSLGRLALHLVSAGGKPAEFGDLSATQQTLDLWTGRLSSKFMFDGKEVEVETSVHPDLDLILVRLRSALLADGRLSVDLRFPGVARNLNPDPADWSQPEAHRTREVARDARGVTLERRLDATRYTVKTSADHDVEITRTGPHAYRFGARRRAAAEGGGDTLTLLVLFSQAARRGDLPSALPGAELAREAVARHWQKYWNDGAVVDFSGSTDPRAGEWGPAAGGGDDGRGLGWAERSAAGVPGRWHVGRAQRGATSVALRRRPARSAASRAVPACSPAGAPA